MRRALLMFALLLPLSLYGLNVTTTTTGGGITDPYSYAAGIAPDCTGASQDTITIVNGATLTMNVSCAANITTAGVGGTGALQVSSGVTWTTWATPNQGNAIWTVGAGATIWLKSDTPIGWNAGDTSVANGKLILGAEGGARVTIKCTNAAGVANTTRCTGFKNSSGSASAVLNAYNVDWIDIGAATTDGYAYSTNGGRAGALTIAHGNRLIRSGELRIQSPAATEGWELRGNSFYDTVETSGRAAVLYNVGAPSGNPTRVVVDTFVSNGFFRVTAASNDLDIGTTIDNMVVVSKVGGTVSENPTGLVPRMTVNKMLLLARNGSSTTGLHIMPCGSVSTLIDLASYSLASADHDNARVKGCSSLSIDGAIFQQWNTLAAESGDALVHDGGITTVESLSLRHALLLPGVNGGGFKSILVDVEANLTANSNTVEHNTLAKPYTNFAGCSTEATTTGAAGVYTSCRDNLIWAAVSKATSGLCTHAGTGTPADGTFTACDYNYTYNITGTSYPLAAAKYASTPGTHDASGSDPKFVDSSMDFLAWGKSIDPTISDWDTLVARMDMNAPGYDSRYSIPNAYSKITSSWAPRNASLKTAAHDGSYIGAVAPKLSSGNALMFSIP